MAYYTLVMCRHGESEFNKQNLFCGWYDSKLSTKGEQEAHNAGKAILDAGYKFDVAYTSVLSRAIRTLEIILKELNQECIPVYRTWRLNERHYGALTGLNKAETAQKYGEEQVKIWRRSYDIPPPPMDCSHKYFKEIVDDPRYKDLPKSEMPLFESLKMTIERTMPHWECKISKDLMAGKKVLVAAHGNSLRGLVKHIENISDEGIINLNLPTGIPFVYEFDCNLKAIGSMRFLGDPETVKKAMESVAAQGKAK